MISKQQAETLDRFHAERPGRSCEIWRRNGKTQTWKRSPGRFRTPVKWGLSSYMQLTDTNAHLFHSDQDCPGVHR